MILRMSGDDMKSDGVQELEKHPTEHDYLQDIARSAFADMLHDTERNELYERGISWAIGTMRSRGVSKVVVLDIGTGSGLLAMLACRHGADVVYACDGFPPAVQVAEQVLKDNACESVRLIPKRSTELVIGVDMETRAHILVTEVFDTELIGEGAIETFKHAVEHLLTRDCIIVPQEATIYAQVVESSFLRSHHELKAEGLNIPPSVRDCEGSASLHDIQLSQLVPGEDFTPVTKPIEVLHFDFNKLEDTPTSEEFPIANSDQLGTDAVFMWWSCKMAPGVVLSCAPHWAHPEGKKQPWRDHWMQAVYYPKNTSQGDCTLCCSRDQFSLWFHIDWPTPKGPVCKCGIHYTTSRSRLAQLGQATYPDDVAELVERMGSKNILLIGDSSFTLPLHIAKKCPEIDISIKETNPLTKVVTGQFVKFNSDLRVTLLKDNIDNEELKDIDLVISEPFFTNSLLPWENYFQMKKQIDDCGLSSKTCIPGKMTVWIMYVDFDHLWKIRAPIVRTVGLDMLSYDKLIQKAISQCDSAVEPQPLWEYPSIARSEPIKLSENPLPGSTLNIDRSQPSNGIALWCEYAFDDKLSVSTGPTKPIEIGQYVSWNRFTKQAVILDSAQKKYSIVI